MTLSWEGHQWQTVAHASNLPADSRRQLTTENYPENKHCYYLLYCFIIKVVLLSSSINTCIKNHSNWYWSSRYFDQHRSSVSVAKSNDLFLFIQPKFRISSQISQSPSFTCMILFQSITIVLNVYLCSQSRAPVTDPGPRAGNPLTPLSSAMRQPTPSTVVLLSLAHYSLPFQIRSDLHGRFVIFPFSQWLLLLILDPFFPLGMGVAGEFFFWGCALKLLNFCNVFPCRIAPPCQRGLASLRWKCYPSKQLLVTVKRLIRKT